MVQLIVSEYELPYFLFPDIGLQYRLSQCTCDCIVWEDVPNDPDVLYDRLAQELALSQPVVVRYRSA